MSTQKRRLKMKTVILFFFCFESAGRFYPITAGDSPQKWKLFLGNFQKLYRGNNQDKILETNNIPERGLRRPIKRFRAAMTVPSA